VALPEGPAAASGDGFRLDPDQLLAHAGNDPTLARELAGIFLDEAPKWLAQIDEALRLANPREVGRAAHQLKGALGHCGVDGVRDLALRLERTAQDDELARAPVVAEQLHTAVQGLYGDLRRFLQLPA
jgi:HPt (histidine-containing phosphotransfer) domain-containing protein